MKHFDGLRKAGGLSGYPSRAESEDDVIENSHASTVLAYADGLAKARQMTSEQDRAIVAVIGDGAPTGGAIEAMDNIGAADDRPVIVVLNDNTRSYAPTIGGLSRHLHQLRTEAVGATNGESAPTRGTAADQGVLGPLSEAKSLFELLGIAYLGPIDRHNQPRLEEALRTARQMRAPVVIHTVTTKGKGMRRRSRTPPSACTRSASWTRPPASCVRRPARELDQLFRRRSVRPWRSAREVGRDHGDDAGPTGLARFAQRFPDQCFDGGIVEQHAVTSAAGLALGGLRPVVAVYATFMGRAFDQVLMDVALHKLPITFVLDRAGITGPDGASHHGIWDLAVFSNVPGLRICAPRDAARLTELLTEAVGHAGWSPGRNGRPLSLGFSGANMHDSLGLPPLVRGIPQLAPGAVLATDALPSCTPTRDCGTVNRRHGEWGTSAPAQRSTHAELRSLASSSTVPFESSRG